ncbi:MAG: hypothetical protein RL757_1123 [Bacteroidota bacterium]|jgi:hypothetical protein
MLPPSIFGGLLVKIRLQIVFYFLLNEINKKFLISKKSVFHVSR